MKFSIRKKYCIPAFISIFLFVGVSFQNDFFELAKQIEIFTSMFKAVNQNYVEETNQETLWMLPLKTC